MSKELDGDQVAGNGLLDRRVFLRQGGGLIGAVGAAVGLAGYSRPVEAETLVVPEWTKKPGALFEPYTQPSKFETKVVRGPIPPSPYNGIGPGNARSPLQHLEGMITPNGVHYERSHNGVPDIAPDGTLGVAWRCKKARNLEPRDLVLRFDGATQSYSDEQTAGTSSVSDFDAFAPRAGS